MKKRPIWIWLLTIEDIMVRNLALQNFTRYKNTRNSPITGWVANSAADAIDKGFNWSATAQGSNYWRNINQQLRGVRV